MKHLRLMCISVAPLLLAAGFLNPQQPDVILDELLSLLRRSHPTRREAELLLAALAQLTRTQTR